ncbi:hypothetical protein N0V94_000930 [Neodidymelliopsis sp. IMI 364377]|nr:hypothetical protein N0V94_000930 [Neodidymelliopsis sp. IMI 364377]
MPPAPAPRLPVIDPDRGALLAGILGGTKLRKVPDSEKKDKSVVERGKVIGEVNAQAKPIYESTPHSRDVEALEHAQDVEEKEIQEEVLRGKSHT